jgi:ABC-2 type transport system ATP-binding protein
MLAKLRQHNITILVSTPYMDEAMRCDRVALIQNGKILSVETPRQVKAGFSRKLFMIKASEKFKLITALRKYPETLTAYAFGDSVHVTLSGDKVEESLFTFLHESGLNNIKVEETQAGIEDRFLELMQKGKEE